ncbi:MAG: 50S ribosomal protein L6 [Calditrichaeota bacterium]|nr:50S ribosomal protein L6 [Calditrichota bacterium]
MSRIGKLPIPIPDKVSVTVNGRDVHVKGPLGELYNTLRDEVEVKLEDSRVWVRRRGDTKLHRALHGLSRTVVSNMVEGVSQGFEKILVVIGVGYTAELKGDGVMLRVGYSHPVWIGAPPGIKFELLQPSQWAEAGVEKQAENQNVAIRVSGIDKALLGQVAARIRRIRPPEPYKGKGIRYNKERVRRKAGKAAK